MPPAGGFSRQPAGTLPLLLLLEVLELELQAAVQLLLPHVLSAVPRATPLGNCCSQLLMHESSLASHWPAQLKTLTQSELLSHAVSSLQQDVFAHVTQDVSSVAAAQAPVPPVLLVDDVAPPSFAPVPKRPSPPLLLDEVPVPVDVPLHATRAPNAKNTVTPTP